MGQTLISIGGNQIMPYPQKQDLTLNDTWTGTALSNGLTIITADSGNGNAITNILIGYGRNDSDYNAPKYNDLATFGGQTTPVTEWLSTAQDDSWAPRYQSTPEYWVTTQVPPQQTPFMTHIYSFATVPGVWKVAYVIDDNNFAVYDPNQTATGSFGAAEIIPICQNLNPATSIEVQGDSSATATFYFSQTTSLITGPFNFKLGPNQEGIVEPFLIKVSAGTVNASITY